MPAPITGPMNVAQKPTSAYPDVIGSAPQAPVTMGFDPQQALAGAAPATAMIGQNKANMDQNQQAAQFHQLLNSGVQGMQAYVQEVAKQNPEVGQKAMEQFQLLSPFIPQMKPDEQHKAIVGFYDSIDNQVSGTRMRKTMKEGVPSTDINDPAGTMKPATIMDILAQSNMGGKDLAGSLNQEMNRQALDPLRQSQIAKNNATTDYTNQRADLQRELQASRERMQARTRAVQRDKSGNYVMTLDTAMKNKTAIEADIQSWNEKIAMAGAAADWNPNYYSHLNALQAGLRQAQNDIDRATEHGAKPTDMIATSGPTAPGFSPAPMGGSAGSSSRPTPQSTDQEIAAYLRANMKPDTPQAVAQYKALMQQGAKPAGAP